MNDDVTRSLELMRRAQGGDEEALNRLVARYYERVRPIVRARLGARLRRRVETGDILQNTFVAVIQTYDRFEVRNEASLISWMARIAERQILDEVDRQRAKKRRADREVALDAVSGERGEALDLAGEGGRPDEEVERREERLLLEDCIAELSEPHREIILLRDYAGHSWKEVAELTGRPSPDAARMMHAQARIELAKLLKRHRASGGDEGLSEESSPSQ